MIRKSLAITSLLMFIILSCGACGKKAPPIPKQRGDLYYYSVNQQSEGIGLCHAQGEGGG